MLPKRAIIVGSGNSLRQPIQDGLWEKIQNEFTISLNFNYHYFHPTIQLFCDHDFYICNKENIDKFELVIGKFSQELIANAEIGKNVILLNPSGKYFGTKSWQNGFYSGALGGLFSLTFAIALGFNEIYILGMDWCSINGFTHFYAGNNDGIGIKKVPSGEPGNFMNITGVGMEPSDPTLYKTGCFNSDASRLFNVYHPIHFLEIDLDEIVWKEILIDIQIKPDRAFVIWLEQYLSEEDWKFIKTVPQRQIEQEDYIKFYKFKKLITEKINLMIEDLGLARVTEIFWPRLCTFYGIKKELQNIAIYNVSPQSKIECFPKIDYPTFFQFLKTNPININQDEVRNEIRNLIAEKK